MVKELFRKIKENRIINGNTVKGATNPGEIVLSRRKLIALFPELRRPSYMRKVNRLYFKEKGGILLQFSRYLYFGDCNPAIVISENPLYVASYAQDMDCVVLTSFPLNFFQRYNLKVGSRLLCVNTYGVWKQTQEDIIENQEVPHFWNAFRTLIGDFLSEDIELIKKKKQSISEHVWRRCEELAYEYPQKMPNTYRSCNPLLGVNPIMVKGVKKNPLSGIG